MENPEGDGAKVTAGGVRAKIEGGRPFSLARALGMPSPVSAIDGVIFLPLSNLMKIALPPLFISSLPKRAIGFSFPRGLEGKLLGVSLLGATAALSFLLDKAFGVYPAVAIFWLMGGTGAVIVYNSMGPGLAFVKQMCSTCRLRPIIEEHEKMHLDGVASEDEVWRMAKQKYTYEGLGLGTDPKIHSFCPISKRLKETR
jgi:hypothetical protein